MSLPSKAVANYFLDLAERDAEALTPIKLQKLVYFAHGWHLALTGEGLLDEQIEARRYGPVIPSLFAEFREFGISAVTRRATELRPQPGSGRRRLSKVSIDEIEGDHGFEKSLIAQIWKSYGGCTAIQLSNMAHEPGSPWRQIAEQYAFKLPKGTDIPPDFIKKYFAAGLQQASAT